MLYANSDTGAAGRHLITELEQAGEYKFEPRSDEAALKEATIKQEGTVGVFIPAGYTAALLAGEPPQISIYELRASESSIMMKLKITATAAQIAEAAHTVAAAGGNRRNAGAARCCTEAVGAAQRGQHTHRL